VRNGEASVRGLLERYSTRVLPLTRSGTCPSEEAETIRALSAASLPPGARAAEASIAGLLLLAGCWDESHEVSQEIGSKEGSYWHGIVHRMEPDAGNAGYWFRRVGVHPIFPELHCRALEIVKRQDLRRELKGAWDPFLFIDWCEDARRAPGSELERAMVEIQRAEWDLLFEWCALPPRNP
jgi:hypothetical protein